jgi:penicillin-binding protein 1B
VSPAEAYLLTSLLLGAMDSGTGAPARALGVTGPVAGKTGTTNDGRDAWFVGYHPELVALVWVGDDGGHAHGLSGADAALPIWAEFMRLAMDAYPPPGFAVPPGVVTVPVDPDTGLAAAEGCPVARSEVVLEGSVPPPCEAHRALPGAAWWRRFLDWLGR